MIVLDLSRPSTVKAVMAAHGIRPQHRLGQNFLVEARVLDRIVAACELTPEDLVLEIGPGLGSLTQRLAGAAGRVVAVELDRSLVSVLQRVLADLCPNVEIVHGDAAKIDLHRLLEERLEPGRKAKVAANLPYYITTPLLMRLLEEGLPLERIVVMVQKEVADRMVASPGSKEYGALSVAVQYYTEAEIVTRVARGAFLPPPEVDSAVVRMVMRREPPVSAPREAFFAVVRAAFGQRRKTLLNALAAGLGADKGVIARALEGAGVEPSRRGETLSLEEFAAVARNLYRSVGLAGEING